MKAALLTRQKVMKTGNQWSRKILKEEVDEGSTVDGAKSDEDRKSVEQEDGEEVDKGRLWKMELTGPKVNRGGKRIR